MPVASIRISLVSAPLAPAFMRSAPPMVPGMPKKNSIPPIFAAAAVSATRLPSAAAAALRSGVMSGKVMPTLSTILVASPRSPQRLQFARQRIGPLRDVAGAEADDKIAAAGKAFDDAREIGRFLQRDHLTMAVRAQAE